MSLPASLRRLTWNLRHALLPFPPGNAAQCQESSYSLLLGSRRRYRSSSKIDADLLTYSHSDMYLKLPSNSSEPSIPTIDPAGAFVSISGAIGASIVMMEGPAREYEPTYTRACFARR